VDPRLAPHIDGSTYGIFYGTLYVMTTTIEELMESALDARRVAQNAIRVAVREARAADWSWDRISAALGGSPNGETLRRNFGGDEQRLRLPGYAPVHVGVLLAGPPGREQVNRDLVRHAGGSRKGIPEHISMPPDLRL